MALLLFHGSPAAAVGEEAPKALSFEQAVNLALARNPSVRTAREEVKRAEALIFEARAPSLPTLFGTAGYTRLDGDRLQGTTVIAAANQLSASVTALLPLVAPRSWVAWAHARDNLDVSKLSVDEIRQRIAALVAHTYLSLVAQHRVVEVTERAQAAAKAHFDYAHQRFAGGYGNRLDEVRAQQELKTDDAEVEVAYAQLVRLREALGVLIGLEGPVEVDSEVALPALPGFAEALAESASARADVRLFQLRLTAARHLRRDNWTEYMPTLSASFQAFVQNPPTLILPETGFQAQLILSLPLYDGGVRTGLGRERRALENEARIALEDRVRQAASEVRVAQEEVRRAERALSEAREAARLAHEGLSLSTLGYRAGAATNIELIDAERRARDADTAVAIGEDAYRQGVLDLLIASGRFPSRMTP